MKWWLSAADRGNALAQMKTAYLYEEGRGGTAVDYTQAYKWYDIAAAVVGARCGARQRELNARDPSKRVCGGYLRE